MEQTSNEVYKQVVPCLSIIPARPIYNFNFASTCKMYKLSPTTAVVKSPEGAIGPNLPVGDFWQFLQVRTKKTGKPLHGLRHDWLKAYAHLLAWDGTVTSTETLHCEIKLALDCLHRQRTGKVVVGVSKQKCLCCG